MAFLGGLENTWGSPRGLRSWNCGLLCHASSPSSVFLPVAYIDTNPHNLDQVPPSRLSPSRSSTRWMSLRTNASSSMTRTWFCRRRLFWDSAQRSSQAFRKRQAPPGLEGRDLSFTSQSTNRLHIQAKEVRRLPRVQHVAVVIHHYLFTWLRCYRRVCFGIWCLGHLNLFRTWCFGFGVSAACRVPLLSCG